jgi:hypothetical protein
VINVTGRPEEIVASAIKVLGLREMGAKQGS